MNTYIICRYSYTEKPYQVVAIAFILWAAVTELTYSNSCYALYLGTHGSKIFERQLIANLDSTLSLCSHD